MFSSRWIWLAALYTCSSFAAVSFEEKQERVESLMKLQSQAPVIAFEVYQRELQYEKQQLSVEERAKRETNLLANKIRNQVLKAYAASLKKFKNPELAREEIRTAIHTDLNLANPQFKEDLLELATETLDTIDSGGYSKEVDLAKVESVIKKDVISRVNFLNNDLIKNKGNTAPAKSDAERTDYASRSELMKALVSDRDNGRFVFTSHQTIKTGETTQSASKISLQVKFSFLGVAVEAGPTIEFLREYSTHAMIMAEGLNPVLLNDGNFDRWKRDANNRIVKKNGVEQKRYIVFMCDASLSFETDYAGGGGFTFLGLGGGGSVTQKFTNSVTLTSRRIALPEYVAGKSMTIKYVSELCHKDFLKARFSNSMTVDQSLDVMMKNVVAGLEFSHAKTKCATDEHCYEWFNREVISLVKIKNFPRCAETNNIEKFRSCQLRGLEGQHCPVYEKGKRTSSGAWEYACDKGLKCVKYENQTFFMGSVWSYAKGKCQVINKKTYRNPFDLAWENADTGIEVTLE